jgi:hypothetical protein
MGDVGGVQIILVGIISFFILPLSEYFFILAVSNKLFKAKTS